MRLSRNPAGLVAALALYATSVVPATGQAHSAASILGVLGDEVAPVSCLAQAPPTPAAVLTSIGPAWATEDGSWAIGCASDYDRADALLVEATADLSGLVAVADGALYVSDDRGCSFVPVAGVEGYVQSVAAGGDRRFALTRDEAQVRVIEVVAGAAVEVGAWPRAGDAAFVADGIEAVDDGGVTWVVVAGARPTPGLWIGRDDGEGLTWRSVGGATFDVGIQRVVPRAVTLEHGPWLLETLPEGRRLLAPAQDQGLAALWEQPDGRWHAVGDPATSVHGPVRQGDAWLTLVDGTLWRSPALAPDERISLGDTSWTCLAASAGEVFACDLYTLWHVPADAPSVASASASMTTTQLGPARAECTEDAERQTACDADWIHYAAENAWLDTEPALCPGDARRDVVDAADPAPDAGEADAPDAPDASGRASSDVGGCGVAHGPGASWPLLALLGCMRRRARS